MFIRYTAAGLVKFDNSNWTLYKTSNSDLPSNSIRTIAIDNLGNKWIGSRGGGLFTSDALVRFDDSTWTVNSPSNWGFPAEFTSSIAIDNNGNKWIGSAHRDFDLLIPRGLAMFDGSTWMVYNTSNSDLPSNRIKCITIDDSDYKWIGTSYDGLAVFDDRSWTVYNKDNSGLPNNYITSIAIDKAGNKWIGTDGGLAVYNSDGILALEENNTTKDIFPEDYLLFQNYPNPFNPTTIISYQLPSFSNVDLSIYNLLGQKVATLVNERQRAGYHQIEWDAGRFSSGIYFYRIEAGEFQDVKKMILLR